MNDLVAPPDRRATMRLRDGRLLAWSEWCPSGGTPLLFCTGAGCSGWLGFGAGDLAELGIRLIAIDRPGLGQSDPHPTKTLSSWADDVREFIRFNHLGAALAIGFSQGAPFAFALAGAGLVYAVAIVSGQDELSHPRLRPLLHPDVEGMLAACERDPAAFERRFAEMASPDMLWRLIIATSSDRDRRLYETEPFASAFQRALKEGFSQGAGGYTRDLVNALGAWPVRAEEITIPVDLWYGGADTSTVHSPDFGATLAARLPNASHTFDRQEGGSILWTRSRDILAKLKSHLF